MLVYIRVLSKLNPRNKQNHPVIFARKGKDENSRTMGFVNYGEVNYQSQNSSQPMNIAWELTNPMPSEIWHEAGKLTVG